jgi:hypothetical protein
VPGRRRREAEAVEAVDEAAEREVEVDAPASEGAENADGAPAAEDPEDAGDAPAGEGAEDAGDAPAGEAEPPAGPVDELGARFDEARTRLRATIKPPPPDDG